MSTGRSDWASKIELDTQIEGTIGVNVAMELKRLLRDTGGVMVGNGSFSVLSDQEGVEVHLFPQGKVLRKVSPTAAGFEMLLEWCKSGADVAAMQGDAGPMEVRDITSTTILICSHASRDVRCGILGPLLKNEFENALRRAGFVILDKPSTALDLAKGQPDEGEAQRRVSIGLISHVGGHKWAGNVIIYFPRPSARGEGARGLEGRGVWYGRVEPKHAEGLVRETVVGGRVIEELCRGTV